MEQTQKTTERTQVMEMEQNQQPQNIAQPEQQAEPTVMPSKEQAALKTLLDNMVMRRASDIFIEAGLPITCKVGGNMEKVTDDALRPEGTHALISQIYTLAHRDMSVFEKNHNKDDDFSFALAGTGRFRVNVFRQRGTYGAVIRIIPFELPDAQSYSIPDNVMELANLKKGMVLITGPAGAGKSSTLACLIDDINANSSGHVITMEDPIEYVHRHNNCIVTQREIPTDVGTFAEAMRSAMREAPDVMLLGEMRDPETISIAMTAAEMAQLLFSTLHTTGAANTIDRIVDSFPANQQHQIRMQLSMVLQAVVSQQLVPTVDGRVVPAFEVMVATPAICNLIREGKTHQIDSVIASSAEEGMITMDQSLYDLVEYGIVTKETALQHAIHQEALKVRLETLR